MPRISTIPPTTRFFLITAWHSSDAVSEIALRHSVTPAQVYGTWSNAKKRGLLPNTPRAEGHIYPTERENYHDQDVSIPDPDPLLARLARHHRPGHGELTLRSPT